MAEPAGAPRTLLASMLILNTELHNQSVFCHNDLVLVYETIFRSTYLNTSLTRIGILITNVSSFVFKVAD